MNTDYIAKRSLLFSEKGSDVRSQFVVKISFPYEVTEEDVIFRVNGTLTRCDIAIEGVETNYAQDQYGVDSVQAVNTQTFRERL